MNSRHKTKQIGILLLLLVFLTMTLSLHGCGGGGSGVEGEATSQDLSPTGPREAVLSWQAPTSKANESALTDLLGFKIYYGTASGVYSGVLDIAVPTATSHTIQNLSPATYYFAVTAYDSSMQESSYSSEVSKAIP